MKNIFVFLTSTSGEPVNKGNYSGSFGIMSAIGQIFFMLAVLCFVLFLIYVFARSMGKFRMGVGNSNIKIIEYKRIGMNSNLLIVNISNKYYLLSQSKDRVNFLSELSESDINFDDSDKKNIKDFKGILDSYFDKNKSGKDRLEP